MQRIVSASTAIDGVAHVEKKMSDDTDDPTFLNPAEKAHRDRMSRQFDGGWGGYAGTNMPGTNESCGYVDDALRDLTVAAPEAAAAIHEGTAATGAPVELLLASFLGLAFGASAGGADVASPRGRKQPLAIAIKGVGHSGVGKTPAWLWFLGIMEDIEDRYQIQFEERVTQHKTDNESYKAKYAREKKRYTNAEKRGVSEATAQAEMDRVIASAPVKPVLRQSLIKDATRLPFVAALAAAPFVFVGSSEGDPILSGEMMKNLAVHCSALDGEGTGASRADGNVRRALSPRPVYCIFTQPPSFEKFAFDPKKKARDSGYLARNLIFTVKTHSQKGAYLGDSVSDLATKQLLDRAIELIAEAWEVFEGRLPRVTLVLSEEAKASWNQIDDFFQTGRSPGGRFEAVSEYAAKAPLLVLRVAAAVTRLCSTETTVGIHYVQFAYAVVMASLEEYMALFSPENCQRRVAAALWKSIEPYKALGMRFLAKNFFLKMKDPMHRNKDSLEMAIRFLIKEHKISLTLHKGVVYINTDPFAPISPHETYWTELALFAHNKGATY